MCQFRFSEVWTGLDPWVVQGINSAVLATLLLTYFAKTMFSEDNLGTPPANASLFKPQPRLRLSLLGTEKYSERWQVAPIPLWGQLTYPLWSSDGQNSIRREGRGYIVNFHIPRQNVSSHKVPRYVSVLVLLLFVFALNNDCGINRLDSNLSRSKLLNIQYHLLTLLTVSLTEESGLVNRNKSCA